MNYSNCIIFVKVITLQLKYIHIRERELGKHQGKTVGSTQGSMLDTCT